MAFSGTLLSPQRDFDRILEIRAQKHEHLRARKNVTLCRNPRREFDSKLTQIKLKDKRYVEFQKRRPGSPEWSSLKSTKLHLRRMNSAKAAVMKDQSLPSKTKTLNIKMEDDSPAPELLETNSLPNSRERNTQSPCESASLWLEEKTLMRSRKAHGKKPVPAASELIQESNKQNRTSSGNNTKAALTTFIKTERNHNTSKQTPLIIQEMFLGRTAEQTDSDSVTVKETDILRLADYLQEALWREERAKKKLAALQDSISGLYGSLEIVWTSRCREDLLKSKIKTLEAQLHHVCVQSVHEDGAKKLLVQKEEERLVYEEKAMVALQKAMLDKSEALSKAETLQEELLTAKEETLRWNNLYKELNMETSEMKQSLRLSMENLQQLHRQLELSRATENDLKEEVSALRQENRDLQYDILLLEENGQALRDEIQQLREDDKDDGQDFVMQELLLSNKAELELTERRDPELEEKLRHTEEKLQLKERECEELQTELKTMEHECHSSQTRLTQCREELRLISHRHRKQTLCVSWWRVCVLLLFVAVCGVAMLWMCHPPFRELVEDLYSDIETHIEGCLLQMVSPQRPGCFRPI